MILVNPPGFIRYAKNVFLMHDPLRYSPPSFFFFFKKKHEPVLSTFLLKTLCQMRRLPGFPLTEV